MYVYPKPILETQVDEVVLPAGFDSILVNITDLNMDNEYQITSQLNDIEIEDEGGDEEFSIWDGVQHYIIFDD